MDIPLDIDEAFFQFKFGKKILVRARYDHKPDSLDPNSCEEVRLIRKGEEGLILKIRDLDSPDYLSSFGMGLEILWSDVKTSYIEHWLINGIYFINTGVRKIPIIDSYADFFNVIRVK